MRDNQLSWPVNKTEEPPKVSCWLHRKSIHRNFHDVIYKRLVVGRGRGHIRINGRKDALREPTASACRRQDMHKPQSGRREELRGFYRAARPLPVENNCCILHVCFRNEGQFNTQIRFGSPIRRRKATGILIFENSTEGQGG